MAFLAFIIIFVVMVYLLFEHHFDYPDNYVNVLEVWDSPDKADASKVEHEKQIAFEIMRYNEIQEIDPDSGNLDLLSKWDWEIYNKHGMGVRYEYSVHGFELKS